MTEYIKREDAIKALGEEPYVWSDTDVEIAEHAQWVSDVKAIEAVPSADVVELELSPVCYKCDGKTADGVRTKKCLWLNEDISKCIKQAHKLLYLAEREKEYEGLEVDELEKSDRKNGEWDMFDLISSAYYGKGMYFKQDNGTIYSRHSGEYMTFDEAIREFISLIDEDAICVPSVTTAWADGEAPTYVLQKRGKWLHKKITADFHAIGQCSVCKEIRRIDNFCPNCGADMRKES